MPGETDPLHRSLPDREGSGQLWREALKNGVGRMVNRCLDVDVGGSGSSGSSRDTRGLDTYLPADLGKGTTTLPELLRSEGDCRRGSMTSAVGGLRNLEFAIMKEQALVLSQPVAVGFQFSISVDGIEEGCCEGEGEEQEE